jgi:hypothetical protein
VVPVIVFLLAAFYWKKFFLHKKGLIISCLRGFVFLLILALNTELLGFARVQQSSMDLSNLNKTHLFLLTKSPLLGRAELVWDQYILHFEPTFMFISGDKNPRLSTQYMGEFYWLELPMLLLGLVYLIWKRSPAALIVLVWAAISPLPSSLAAEAPHAARSLFMAGSFNLIAGLGLVWGISLLRQKYLQIGLTVLVLGLLSFQFSGYLNDYLTVFTKKYAIEYQYGMKQIVQYVKKSPEFKNVYTTAERSQPYIFYLYYLKTPPADFLKTVRYNSDKSRSYNLVTQFGNYHFGGDWDPRKSSPVAGNLYVLTPSEYDGLYDKQRFTPVEIVNYPNKTSAFYLVTAY